MPVYNDEALVGRAIESLQQQSLADFELIISDNASPDRTVSICEAYALRDPRIRVVRQPVNGGQSTNFTFVLGQATGDYFAWVCSDDSWHPEFLQRSVAAIEARPDAIGAFGPFVMTDANDRIIEERHFDYSGETALARLHALAWHWDDGHEYALFRREAMADLTFPHWLGPNSESPYYISMPVLFFLLARGEIVPVEGPPLLRKRKRGGGFHYHAGSNSPFLWYAAQLLLFSNVFFTLLRWCHRGGRSVSLVAAMIPATAARMAIDAVRPVPGLGRYAAARAVRLLVGESCFAALKRRVSEARRAMSPGNGAVP